MAQKLQRARVTVNNQQLANFDLLIEWYFLVGLISRTLDLSEKIGPLHVMRVAINSGALVQYDNNVRSTKFPLPTSPPVTHIGARISLASLLKGDDVEKDETKMAHQVLVRQSRQRRHDVHPVPHFVILIGAQPLPLRN